MFAAMEMGSGKTLASLATLCVLRGRSARGQAPRALFVVPKSTLHDAWLRQTRAFTRLRAGRDATFMTYPEMQRAFTQGWRRVDEGPARWVREGGSSSLEQKWDLLVFDESHVLRNPKRGSVLGYAHVSRHVFHRVLRLFDVPILRVVREEEFDRRPKRNLRFPGQGDDGSHGDDRRAAGVEFAFEDGCSPRTRTGP